MLVNSLQMRGKGKLRPHAFFLAASFLLLFCFITLESRIHPQNESLKTLKSKIPAWWTHHKASLHELQLVSQAPVLFPDDSPLLAWMHEAGFSPERAERIPIISIADSKYSQTLRHLRARLASWGRDADLVVICLDVTCMGEKELKGYGGYLNQKGKVMESVALVKMEINLALSKGGYNYVFLDGDVYLTGNRDPFEDMLPLSDKTWDIQIQYDNCLFPNNPIKLVNIGWYFSRSTPATIDFYERSNKSWTESRQWDQVVMNVILNEMEVKEHSINITRLWDPRFQNWMCHDWQRLYFGDEKATQAFVHYADLIHYTCVEQNLKTYFGANFGGYADVDGYYSRPQTLLAISNLSGMVNSVHAQLAFATRLANATGRTFIWPETVDLIQHQNDRYEYRPKFPTIRISSYAFAQEKGLKIVESRYLQNRQAQTGAFPLNTVVLNAAKIMQQGGPTALEQKTATYGPLDVVTIDFSDFPHGAWLRDYAVKLADPRRSERDGEEFAMHTWGVEEAFWAFYEKLHLNEYASGLGQFVRQCRNAEDRKPGCRAICT